MSYNRRGKGLRTRGVFLLLLLPLFSSSSPFRHGVQVVMTEKGKEFEPKVLHVPLPSTISPSERREGSSMV
jgi:hypothetical protein